MDLREKRGVTFLFITHNLAVVDCIADRVGVMYRGRLVETGAAHEVFEQPLHPYTKVLADAGPSIERFGRPQPSERAPPPAPLSEPGGCAFRNRCPLAIARCAAERPELRTITPGRQAACHRAEEMAARPPCTD